MQSALLADEGSSDVRASVTFEDSDVANMGRWTTPQVCEWLHKLKLGQFEKQFTAHEITGDILPILTVEELREMGIATIGPRTYLVKCLKKLKSAYLNKKRNETIWEGKEQLHTCCIPLDVALDYITSCCLPDPPDVYTLTGAHIKITEKVYPMGRVCRFCARGSKLNTIDLTYIHDVDSTSEQTCWGGFDTVYITPEDEPQTKMKVKLGTGPGIVKMVRDGIENCQQRDGRGAQF